MSKRADEAVRRTLAYRSLADNTNTLELLHRHQTSLERARDRAVKSLIDLRGNPPASGSPPVETENAKRTAEPGVIPTSLSTTADDDASRTHPFIAKSQG